MVTPALVLATIQSAAQFGTELLKFAQTEDGMRIIQKSFEDRAAWDKFWVDASAWFKKFVTGELFKNVG